MEIMSLTFVLFYTISSFFACCLGILSGGTVFSNHASPRFISRGNTFKVVSGDTVVLPCEIQNLGCEVTASTNADLTTIVPLEVAIGLMDVKDCYKLPDPLLPTLFMDTESTTKNVPSKTDLTELHPLSNDKWVECDLIQKNTENHTSPSTGPFVIVWKRGTTLLSAGQQLISMDNRISLIGYNLQLKDIRHADQGDYTCQIGDGSQGDLIHTIEILMPPSIQILPPSGQVVTRKGGPVSFECKANGNPTPKVQWSKKDGLLPSGHQVETGYLLNLNDVQRQDGGIYECTASNGIGQPVTGEIKLHVLYPPEVSVIKSWVNAGEGGEAKLDCMVHADPPAEVTWYQDSFILQPTDRRTMSKNGNTHTLTIRNVQSSDFGNYSCLVANSIGKDKRYMELSGKPGPAKVVSGPYSNPHEYDLKWVVQSVFPIIEVRILYRRIMSNASYHHPGHWHDVVVKPAQSYNPANAERTQRYKLTSLFPDSVYECLIQTKNQHGFGELSDLHQWSTSPRGRFIVHSGVGKLDINIIATVWIAICIADMLII